MRFIPLYKQSPDPDWLAKANSLLAELQNTADEDDRKKIIDDNRQVWGELKDWLLSLSHKKCWFSEALDCFNYWHVEHYRPKKSAKDSDGKEHEGYWWLAFDWHNFRICGSVGNTKKGTFFPVRDGTSRATFGGDLRREQPQLLDPADPDDPVLLSFNIEGRAIPAPTVSDAWELDRVNYSIIRYHLNFPLLADRRKVIWANCSVVIKEYLDELTRYHKDKTNDFARAGYQRAARQLREMIHEKEELSSVARACIESTNDDRVLRILMTN